MQLVELTDLVAHMLTNLLTVKNFYTVSIPTKSLFTSTNCVADWRRYVG
jgi:hypothetical protein